MIVSPRWLGRPIGVCRCVIGEVDQECVMRWDMFLGGKPTFDEWIADGRPSCL
jgi:hypothetical protein